MTNTQRKPRPGTKENGDRYCPDCLMRVEKWGRNWVHVSARTIACDPLITARRGCGSYWGSKGSNTTTGVGQ